MKEQTKIAADYLSRVKNTKLDFKTIYSDYVLTYETKNRVTEQDFKLLFVLWENGYLS